MESRRKVTATTDEKSLPELAEDLFVGGADQDDVALGQGSTVQSVECTTHWLTQVPIRCTGSGGDSPWAE